MKRFSLALVYVLATLPAQGVHNHANDSDSRIARHNAGCADSRPHFSGHWSPDLSDIHDDCVVCQFRANHHAWLFTAPPFGGPSVVGMVDLDPRAAPRVGVCWTSCRAPPLRTTT